MIFFKAISRFCFSLKYSSSEPKCPRSHIETPSCSSLDNPRYMIYLHDNNIPMPINNTENYNKPLNPLQTDYSPSLMYLISDDTSFGTLITIVSETLLKSRRLLSGIANHPIRQSRGKMNAFPKLSSAATPIFIF